MATQCRSSKCTAERKGFRRELDSWRHKLIHCVGFESILEGIYGTRLLRDLSIFDDCEPDVVNDWSVDASCSFCSLQLEKIGDHIPAVCSLQLTPTEETSPQGESNTEKIEYQADKFLHAIFRKKDLPQSCDPNIPLVAQELMKRMIRQFAIEYASKSQIQGGKNGSSLDMNLVCDSQHPSDQDGPLDLTVNRNHLNVEQAGGVLDLSQKIRSSATLSSCTNASTNQNTSGSLALAGDEDVHLDTGAEKLQIKCTVLQMVLSSFCPCHRMLLYHILKCMHEDYIISVTPYADGCRHFSQADSLSCHLGKNSDKDMFAFTDYQTSDGCCVHSCRLNSCSMTPVCICLKNLHYFSCQRMAIGCINKVCGPSSCGSYSHPQQGTCTYQSLSKSTYITPVRNVVGSPFAPHEVCAPFSPCIRACSPSPPPLTLIPLDVGAKNSDKSIICPFAESKCFSNQSASPFSHEEEDDPLFHEFDKDNAETEKHTPCDDCTDCCTRTGKNFEQNQSGNVLQNLMECFKQLKPIEPLEKEQNSGLSANQSLACDNSVHLEEILTTILHKETDNDCNLKEHFHRKQETLNAVRSPDLAPSWHQCVQIRREIVSLGPLPCRRKLELETQGKIIVRDDFKTQSCVDVLLMSPEKGKLSESGKSDTTDTCDSRISPHHTELFYSRLENEEESPEDKGKDLKDTNCRNGDTDIKKQQSLSRRPVTDTSRSRRNIVPPQRFSAYVTEPRKMYFAACFSESIFNKRGQKDTKAICAEKSPSDLDLNESTTKLDLQNELPKTVRHARRSGENICDDMKSTDFNLSNTSRTRAAKMSPLRLEDSTSDDSEVKEGFQRRSKRRTVASLVKLRSLTSDQNHLNNVIIENNLSEGINTMKDALSTNECSLTPYSSPIRLMFVSPVISEEGIKYSLKSASSGSVNQPETFDPCVESSWCGLAKTEEKSVEVEPRVARGEENSPHKRPVTTDASSSSEELDIQREACLLVHGLSLSPPKRKPGRPKKLGPQIEKPAKRPIGRPPKHKGDISKCVSSKGSPNKVKNTACHSHDEDGGRRNKNLKITVLYGRSRRIRRLVSESSGHFGTDQQMRGLQSAYGCKTSNDLNENSVMSSANLESSAKLLGGPTEHFDLVIPVKNKRSHSSRNIKCTEQKCSVAMRKPGRPPKVKISGISVTVTTVSPKKRNISIDKDMTELNNEMPQKEKPFVSNHPKEQTTISLQSDAVGEKTENVQGGTMNQKILVPLRHSVRIRKPSVHLLHSVATSRTFTRSNALLRRSRKLLMNKTSSESNQFKSFEKPFVETSGTTNSELFSRNPCGPDLSFLSGISVDSIFASNEPFKWWHTSISAETLNDEFTRRVQVMSDTWVKESVESSNSFSTEKELNLKMRVHQTENEPPKNYFSPVKMLFQTHWNMDKLCAWFMQTTETQSLAIVKKASVRNPYEFVQYNPIRATSRTNVCPSPQAERLRKHVKKFAKIVPKSPAMQLKAQKRMFNAGQLKVKRRLFLRSSSIARGFGQRHLLSRHKMLGKYGFLLLRVKSKFMTRKKLCHDLTRPMLKRASDALSGDLPSKEFQQAFASTIERENRTLNMERKELGVQQPEETLIDVSQEERICSRTWSPERLKECRVFLKKINSPETKSAAEECNFCTIKLDDVSSSGYCLPPRTECAERRVRKERAHVARTESRHSPRILSSYCPEDQIQFRNRKKQKRKSHGTNGSQPLKMARRSLISS